MRIDIMCHLPGWSICGRK